MKRVGEVSYELELTTKLVVVHLVFHILILMKRVGDRAPIVTSECVVMKYSLSYKEVHIEIIHH